MKIRDYSVLIGGGAVSLILAAAAGYLLVRTSGQYRQIATDLRSETGQLEQLRRRSPFPNQPNVQQAEVNLHQLREGLEALTETLARGQMEIPPIEPAQWPLLRQRVFGALNELALQSNVLLPERFAYGFDRYIRLLPDRRNLPRIARQVSYVDLTCRILLDAKVHAIQRIERHVFEEETQAQTPWGEPVVRGRGRRTTAGTDSRASALSPGFFEHPDGLFQRERMVFAFTVRESSLWQILNALTRNDVYCAVSRIQARNLTPRPGLPTQGGGPPRTGRPAPVTWIEDLDPEGHELGAGGLSVPGRRPGGPGVGPLRREERIAAGRDDLLSVELEIDFYTFRHESRSQEARP